MWPWVLLIALALLTAPSPGRAEDRLHDVPGAKLYVEVSGSGPPLVFLHGGLSFFDEAFQAQKAYFSAFRTVIGIDQRGHGHSPDNGQPFSYRQMAQDTAAVLQQLHVSHADVIGHSDGGDVGLLLASQHPELVRRLVVSGANLHGWYMGWRGYVWMRWRASDADFERTLDSQARNAYAAVSPDGAAHWPVVAAKTRMLWTTWSVIGADELHAIRTPVLVIAGDHDAIQPEQTLELYQDLPDAQLCILPGTGHETMREHAARFNELVRQFLEQPAGPGAP